MKKIPIPQSANPEEKKELEELLGNIKRVIKIRYIIVGGFALLFLILKLVGMYPLAGVTIILLFLLLALVGICDLLLRKTKLKKTVTKASTSYFILQIIEATLILIALHISGVIPFIGALVLTLILVVSYFSYTRRKYYLAVTIFYVFSYVVVVTFEYLGIIVAEGILNIGTNIARNQGVFILSLTTGTALLITIFLTIDTFSKRLRASLGVLSQKEKELEEAKGVLEIKVKARTKELEEERASLEEKVKERTKELQGKVEELEKFQKIAVGRELKMVELKKEIKELKKR